MKDNLSKDDLVSMVEDLEGELDDCEPGDTDEIADLEKTIDELKTTIDWLHDHAVLIHENAFRDHAIDEADSLGIETSGWPFRCIDWDQAAHELKMDYTAFDVQGITYYTRDCS